MRRVLIPLRGHAQVVEDIEERLPEEKREQLLHLIEEHLVARPGEAGDDGDAAGGAVYMAQDDDEEMGAGEDDEMDEGARAELEAQNELMEDGQGEAAMEGTGRELDEVDD